MTELQRALLNPAAAQVNNMHLQYHVYLSRELRLGSQSHSWISFLCVCARVPFVYEPSMNIYIYSMIT